MQFQSIKTQLVALLGSVVSPEVVPQIPIDKPQLVNAVVQVIIGLLAIIGFIRDNKNR